MRKTREQLKKHVGQAVSRGGDLAEQYDLRDRVSVAGQCAKKGFGGMLGRISDRIESMPGYNTEVKTHVKRGAIKTAGGAIMLASPFWPGWNLVYGAVAVGLIGYGCLKNIGADAVRSIGKDNKR